MRVTQRCCGISARFRLAGRVSSLAQGQVATAGALAVLPCRNKTFLRGTRESDYITGDLQVLTCDYALDLHEGRTLGTCCSRMQQKHMQSQGEERDATGSNHKVISHDTGSPLDFNRGLSGSLHKIDCSKAIRSIVV